MGSAADESIIWLPERHLVANVGPNRQKSGFDKDPVSDSASSMSFRVSEKVAETEKTW